jgi:hypothetical protein
VGRFEVELMSKGRNGTARTSRASKKGPKVHSTFRLSTECLELISTGAEHMGTSQAAIVEMAVRGFFRKRSKAPL